MKNSICFLLFTCLLHLEAFSEEKGFKSIFNGKDFKGWAGPLDNYKIVDGAIQCKKGKGGTIFTKESVSDTVDTKLRDRDIVV